MFVTYLRTLGIPIAIVGWLLFQIFIKRKKWHEVKQDVQVIVFMLAVWIVVYFVLLR
jgi:hypothetical protein